MQDAADGGWAIVNVQGTAAQLTAIAADPQVFSFNEVADTRLSDIPIARRQAIRDKLNEVVPGPDLVIGEVPLIASNTVSDVLEYVARRRDVRFRLGDLR
jgi:hypothetical protein